MQSTVLPTLFAVLVVGGAILLYRSYVERIIVWEYEKGLRYHKGRFVGIVEPGSYRILKQASSIVRIDTRPAFLIVTGQEVLSSDGVSLKVSLAIRYRVVDPHAAFTKIQGYQQAMYMVAQIALREISGAHPIDELLQTRQDLDAALKDKCRPQLEEWGIELVSLSIRDITFPGDLKKLFTQEIRARKEGLAALERARGETAALRNLANAARLMADNPALLQLRTIQSLSESSGNTLVVQLSPGGGVVPLKTSGGEPTKVPSSEES